MSLCECVYILITREFIRSNENVYKIGRTKNLKRRFNTYPKGSELLNSFEVKDSIYVEKQLKKKFTNAFIHRKDIGHEWFEGNKSDILKMFDDVSLEYCHYESQPQLQIIKEVKQTSQTCLNKYVCDCGFSCSSKFNLDRHMLSRLHERNMECPETIIANSDGIFKCTICDFSSSHKGNFRKHILSDKHCVAKERHATQSKTDSDVSNVHIVSHATSDLQNEFVKPVMLIEVLETFLNLLKNQK